MNKIRTAMCAIALLGAGTGVLGASPASAASNGISGATTRNAPCDFFTSSNARVTERTSINATLTSVGTLGVKMRVKWTASGLNSGAQYWSGAENTAKRLTTATVGKEFRLQFSCINSWERPNPWTSGPSTNFSGNLTW